MSLANEAIENLVTSQEVIKGDAEQISETPRTENAEVADRVSTSEPKKPENPEDGNLAPKSHYATNSVENSPELHRFLNKDQPDTFKNSIRSDGKNAFAQVLWDQVKTLEEFSGLGTSTMNQIGDLLTIVASVENECSKQIKRAIQLSQLEQKKMASQVIDSLSTQAWEKLINALDEVSNFHADLSDQILTTGDRIKTSTKELENSNLENYRVIHLGYAELPKKAELLSKMQIKYDKDMKEVDNEIESYPAIVSEYQELQKKSELLEKFFLECEKEGQKVSIVASSYKKGMKELSDGKLKLEKVTAEYQKKMAIGKESTIAYSKLIDEVNEAKNNYYSTTLPSHLEKIQRGDEYKRINFIRKELKTLGSKLGESFARRKETWEKINREFAEIDRKIDYSFLVTKYKTENSFPEDFNIADSEEDVKKKVLMKPLSSKQEMDTEDKILELIKDNPKKGKKAAKIRYKEIVDDINHLEKKKKRFGAFLELKNDIRLNSSILECDARLELLKQKKNKFDPVISTLSIDNLRNSEYMLTPETSTPGLPDSNADSTK